MPTESLTTSEKIKLELDRQKVSPLEFSSALGIAQSAMHRRLRLNAWDLKTLEKVAAALGTTVQDLI
jgi:DNA-binding Xre family transcriptional regulator